MHPVLKRQLKRHFGEGHPPPLECAGFISAVDAAYEQADLDRERLDRALELSSQELLQANAELRSVFQAMEDLVFVFDSDGRCRKVVETNPSVFLKPIQWIAGQRVHEILPEQTADLFVHHIHLALKHQRKEKLEFSVPIHGQVIRLDGTFSPLSETTVLWVARDVNPHSAPIDLQPTSNAMS